ncbi:probable carboxylesterase 18 [Musa acuminata AAA Group]|uniref:probable carboxylesterase 18 n=1 Tax=Musa acuminata AAA Group TaxID=214697 RepID=UPI0031D6CD50
MARSVEKGDSEMATARPPLPLKTRLIIAAITAATDAACRRDGTVNRRLFNLFDRRTPPNPSPIDGVATADHTVDPSRHLWLRLFSPASPAPAPGPLPLIVYFHGGGFTFHSAASSPYDGFCRRLARRVPALVASVEYRLAPEHRCPASYDDGIDVLRWLGNGDLVPDLSAVFLAGDSAGGNIAHHVARRARRETLGRASVAGLVAIQPFFGGKVPSPSEERLGGMPFGKLERFEWMWRSFLPVGADGDHEAANVFGPGSAAADDFEEGFPATMVCVGGWDALQDRQRWYCEGLKRNGVDVRVAEYPDAVHAFYVFPELPDAHKLVDDIADFVHRRMDELSKPVDK